MKSTLSLLILALLCSITRAAIDFNGGTDERTLEGIRFQQLVFRDNGRKVTYEQPRGWNYVAESGRVRLMPPGVSQAQGEIDQMPLTAPVTFDEGTTQKLRQQALLGLPNGNQNAKVELDEKSPFKKNDCDTYSVTISYQLHGQEFSTTVLYLNLPDTLVRFRATAKKPDFEKIQRALRASVLSWQWRTAPAAAVTAQKAPAVPATTR